MKTRGAMAAGWLFAAFACGGGPPSDPDSGEPAADASHPGGGDAAPPSDSSDAPSKIIFATSSKQNGDLGGLAGADRICERRATDAGLAGEFKAWLSSPEESAEERLAHADVPYRRTDGKHIADDWNDLIDGDLAAPIDRDEDGAPISGDVWTGTRPSGATADATCSGFDTTGDSGICGSSTATGGEWSDNIQPVCTSALRLYCVQQ